MFNRLEKDKKNNAIQRRSSLYFAVLALIISGVSFLLLLESHKKYVSEISIIFIPKSEIAAQDAERIIGNMEILPTKMFFYDRMAMYDKDIESKISNFTEIGSEREENSSIVKLSVIAKDRSDSTALAKTAAKTLFNVMGFYYDIKKDADFRIVEDPTAKVSVTDWTSMAVSSLLIGIFSLFAINFIFQNISSYSGSLKRKAKKATNFFEVSRRIKAKPEITKEDEIYQIKAKSPSVPAVPAPLEKKSPAPENLPTVPGKLTFVDEDYFRNNIIKGTRVGPEKTEKPEVAASKTEPSVFAEVAGGNKETADFHREPTQEELKKRLNQLLRGEL